MSSDFMYRRLDKSDSAVLLVDHQSGLCQHRRRLLVTDASGTFNQTTRDAAWSRMAAAGAQLMS